jgi:hypothetical protein
MTNRSECLEYKMNRNGKLLRGASRTAPDKVPSIVSEVPRLPGQPLVHYPVDCPARLLNKLTARCVFAMVCHGSQLRGFEWENCVRKNRQDRSEIPAHGILPRVPEQQTKIRCLRIQLGQEQNGWHDLLGWEDLWFLRNQKVVATGSQDRLVFLKSRGS